MAWKKTRRISKWQKNASRVSDLAKDSTKTEAEIFDAGIKLIMAFLAVTGATFRLAWLGWRQVDWRNWGLYTGHLGPMLATFFIATVDGTHLVILNELFPSVLTIDRLNWTARFPWYVHWVGLYLAANFLTLVVLGIKPFRERLCFQEAIDHLGLKTGTGKRPKLSSLVDLGDFKKKATLFSPGLGKDHYEKGKESIQTSLGWKIDRIERGKRPNVVEIYLAEKELPQKLDYRELLPQIKRPYQFAVGESFRGTVLAKLEDLPHLLVAGVTGAGKSTFLNSLLVTLLKSERLQVYGIDLKKVELALYKAFPNFHVDETLKDATQTLKLVQQEMERRYTLLSERGHRKINPTRDNLDRIVVVVDECSDLYEKLPRGHENFELASECKEITNHLARKGRAAGIHLILATQRASKETLDSRILSNIPAKMCFQMASVSNSVLVLNSKQAYELPKIPGRGFWSLGVDMVQVQAPYIDEKEVIAEADMAKFEFENNQASHRTGPMLCRGDAQLQKEVNEKFNEKNK